MAEEKPAVAVNLCFDFATGRRIPQMLKFSAYGFLKNQKYFTPFLLLFFLAEGLNYEQYGWLMAWSEVVLNIMEIPAGALSDSSGRRRVLVTSFMFYIVCFAGLTLFRSFVGVFIFWTFYACGEAFRGGTHKAMIFEWLKLNSRKDLKVQVYGYTRMWSKLGDALASILGGALVALTGGFHWIFIFSLIPYIINSFNILSYPAALEGKGNENKDISIRKALAETGGTLLKAMREFTNPGVCGFCLEAMLFEGPFGVLKGYMQPLLKIIAMRYVTSPEDTARVTGVLLGGMFFLLFILASWASVYAFKMVKFCGTEQRTAVLFWICSFVSYLVLFFSCVCGWILVAMVCFIVLFAIQAAWRPLLISRLSNSSDDTLAATVLSVEAQIRSLGKALLSPFIGWAVDSTTKALGKDDIAAFWPIPASGVAFTLVGCIICIFISSRAIACDDASRPPKVAPLLEA